MQWFDYAAIALFGAITMRQWYRVDWLQSRIEAIENGEQALEDALDRHYTGAKRGAQP